MELEIQKTETLIPIMEAFYTLQGEGFHSGRAAYFIRTGGCDVGCVWCDVKESWNADLHPKQTVDQIVQSALPYNGRLAVITGGEPLMYDMNALTMELQKAGFETNIETSGVYKLTGNWDWICFSPKKFKEPHVGIYEFAHELKIIINHKSDLEFAEFHAQKVNADCKLFLQTEWEKRDAMTPLIIDYIKNNPKWTLSMQTHKYLDIP